VTNNQHASQHYVNSRIVTHQYRTRQDKSANRREGPTSSCLSQIVHCSATYWRTESIPREAAAVAEMLTN